MSTNEQTRVCGFCITRQPLGEMAMSGTSYQCSDTAACNARAAASDLYSLREDELEIAAREARQGAVLS